MYRCANCTRIGRQIKIFFLQQRMENMLTNNSIIKSRLRLHSINEYKKPSISLLFFMKEQIYFSGNYFVGIYSLRQAEWATRIKLVVLLFMLFLLVLLLMRYPSHGFVRAFAILRKTPGTDWITKFVTCCCTDVGLKTSTLLLLSWLRKWASV